VPRESRGCHHEAGNDDTLSLRAVLTKALTADADSTLKQPFHTRLRIPAARIAPELCMNDPPKEGVGLPQAGSGECRVPVAPAAARVE
jgi:hypothetical protein